LKQILRKHHIEESDINDLERAIHLDPLPEKTKSLGKEVNAWLGKMIGTATNGFWNIAANVATNLLMQAVNQYYGIG